MSQHKRGLIRLLFSEIFHGIPQGIIHIVIKIIFFCFTKEFISNSIFLAFQHIESSYVSSFF